MAYLSPETQQSNRTSYHPHKPFLYRTSFRLRLANLGNAHPKDGRRPNFFSSSIFRHFIAVVDTQRVLLVPYIRRNRQQEPANSELYTPLLLKASTFSTRKKEREKKRVKHRILHGSVGAGDLAGPVRGEVGRLGGAVEVDERVPGRILECMRDRAPPRVVHAALVEPHGRIAAAVTLATSRFRSWRPKAAEEERNGLDGESEGEEGGNDGGGSDGAKQVDRLHRHAAGWLALNRSGVCVHINTHHRNTPKGRELISAVAKRRELVIEENSRSSSRGRCGREGIGGRGGKGSGGEGEGLGED
ncbi:hypothetical protein BHM03_00009938 [Ensete ventricosum]|nr:hypothetical protein BHM03_00009938 [Ensete ventricosum]